MKINLEKYYLIFGVNIIFLPFTFFSINSILGIEYLGLNDSNSYIIVIVISFLLSTFFSSFFFIKKFYTLTELIIFLIPILIILFAFTSSIINGINNFKFISQYLLLVYPSYLFGITLSKKSGLYRVSNLLFIVAIINTTSILFLIPKMILIPTVELVSFFGGGHYQSFSYTAAISFLISLVYYLYYNNYNLNKYLFYTLLLIQLFGIFLSGGRGGIIVVMVGSFCIFYSKFGLYYIIKNSFRFLIFATLLALLINIIYQQYLDRFFESFERLFSFITVSGIDMEKTSNRDTVYSDAIKLISQRPISGYGFFTYQKYTDGFYPHNLILELLLQGGIIYLLLLIAIFSLLIRKMYLLLKLNGMHKFLFVTFLYSFIQLMFSGTYLLDPIFWFNISYTFNARLDKIV